jgi:hypothetical protein
MINDVWKINTECRELLNKQLKNKTIKLNLNGHMSHMNDADVEYITSKIDEMLLCEGLQRKDAEYLIEALSSKKDFDWVSLPIRATGLTCSDCSELLELECNGKEIRCNNPCKHPGGMIYEIELNVPSGRMVVENDLRKWWKVIGNYNVNTPLGCCQTTKKYAEVGMAHAFVGNTCPDVYHIKSDRLAIGISDYRTQRNPIKNTRSVASICTDLWWYSIVDYNDFRSRGLDSPTATVKCRPGVYRFRHLYHTVDRNTPGGKIFTEIEWMRKPDKVVDFVAKYKKLDFSAEQIVADLMKFQTTLDNPENELELIQQKVDYLMCVSGAGADYHENGWWWRAMQAGLVVANKLSKEIQSSFRQRSNQEIQGSDGKNIDTLSQSSEDEQKQGLANRAKFATGEEEGRKERRIQIAKRPRTGASLLPLGYDQASLARSAHR